MLRALPNLLSLARLALAPVVVYALWYRRYEIALGLLLIAGISDGLDGFLARRLQSASQLGAYLDPLADKVLLSSVYVVLAIGRVIPWQLTALVFGRDVIMLIAIGILYLSTTVRKFPPTLWGKLSTFAQICYVFWVVLVRATLWGGGSSTVEDILMWLTAAATAWSGVHYGWIGVRMWRERGAESGAR